MKVVIRVDASRMIGSGHVMRCLALADVLRKRGATVQFVCRTHEGNLIGFIRDRQYHCVALDLSGDTDEDAAVQEQLPEHAPWLGTSWQRDVEETERGLRGEGCDLLIVDHYALDRRWESSLRIPIGKLVVIDDLADRRHDCDILLDAVCGREPEHYQDLVPGGCRLLCGSRFALLRSEFSEWRVMALERRKTNAAVRRFLVMLGGVDPDNLTGIVLDQLAAADLPADSEIEVILGAGSSHTGHIKDLAASMPVKTSVGIAVNNMAERMAHADFAVTAGGLSALECCCLGLPAVIIVTAKNQRVNVAALKKEEVGEIIHADSITSYFKPVFSRTVQDSQWRRRASLRGSRLVDAEGPARVADSVCRMIASASTGGDDG